MHTQSQGTFSYIEYFFWSFLTFSWLYLDTFTFIYNWVCSLCGISRSFTKEKDLNTSSSTDSNNHVFSS